MKTLPPETNALLLTNVDESIATVALLVREPSIKRAPPYCASFATRLRLQVRIIEPFRFTTSKTIAPPTCAELSENAELEMSTYEAVHG